MTKDEILCQGDPVIAEMFRRCGAKPEWSKIVRTDWLATALNRERLEPPERIVELSCGHTVATRAMSRVRCVRCARLMYEGFDYVGYTEGRVRDEMSWPEDPCRAFNEAHLRAG